MPHLTDGSHCRAVPCAEGHPLTAVGWLSGEAGFPQGPMPEQIFRKLCAHAASAWRPPYAAAGSHDCEVCQFGRSTTFFEGYEFPSQSQSELFIPTGSAIFVSPVNIVHSISAHRYLPPPEFLAAVDACPPQGGMPFLKLLLASGGGEWLRALDGADENEASGELPDKFDEAFYQYYVSRFPNLGSMAPQFLTDAGGRRFAAVIPIDGYTALLKDLSDLAAVLERRSEPRLPLEEFKKQLPAEGPLSDPK